MAIVAQYGKIEYFLHNKNASTILDAKMHMHIYMHSFINSLCKNNFIGTRLQLKRVFAIQKNFDRLILDFTFS